jgi:hypothetical protein
MKRLVTAILACIMLFISLGASAEAKSSKLPACTGVCVQVKGYVKTNGTYVSPHVRNYPVVVYSHSSYNTTKKAQTYHVSKGGRYYWEPGCKCWRLRIVNGCVDEDNNRVCDVYEPDEAEPTEAPPYGVAPYVPAPIVPAPVVNSGASTYVPDTNSQAYADRQVCTQAAMDAAKVANRKTSDDAWAAYYSRGRSGVPLDAAYLAAMDANEVVYKAALDTCHATYKVPSVFD